LLRRWRSAAFQPPDSFALLQARARSVRLAALAHLPDLLERLEAQITAAGGVVYWAEDAAAANAYIVNLAQQQVAVTALGQRSRPCRVVKSGSSLSAEIGLTAALRAADAQVVDLALGDYIVQLADEPGSHFAFPAIHKRKEDVAALFREQLDMPETLDVQAMASMARFRQRRALHQADLAISEVTLAAAQTGTLALATASGSERLAVSLPRVHVALMGISDVVADLDELFTLLEAAARSAVGQPLARSITLLNGPACAEDPEGPQQLHLVIVDNGRSELTQSQRGYGEALACIRCGACANACPVYQEVGGQAYGGVKAGPIGAVMIPLLPAVPVPGAQPGKRQRRSQPRALPDPLRATPFADLPWASTLCGACAAVCPVGIDIPRLLLQLRSDLTEAGRMPASGRAVARLWVWAMRAPVRYRLLARVLAASGGLPGWQPSNRRLTTPKQGRMGGRTLPPPARRPFRERWRQRQR
jgi:L-lactate dehydrogenase complex protein LldF